MTDFSSSISGDQKYAKLEIIEGGSTLAALVLNADDLSTVIHNMGEARAHLLPPVTRKLDPNPVFTDVTRNAVFHVDRPHVVSKEFFIAIRHEGFGWLAFTLTAEDGRLLAALIEKQAAAISPKIFRPPGFSI